MRKPILHARTGSCGAFTLTELLVVIGVIGLLGGLLLPALGRARNRAAMINELSSARQVMLAWRMYSEDHSDRVLPGYRYGFEALDRLRRPIAHPINARYPWRLAPYLGTQFEILYVNRNRALLHRFGQGSEEAYTYSASVFPSLGINSIFVGGDDRVLPPTATARRRFGDFCVLRSDQIRRPSDLMAFVSSRSWFDNAMVEGYYRVEAPRLTRRVWASTFSEDLPADQFGFVHPRFNRRAVGAFTDGHAEALGREVLEDMGRWSNVADRPDWSLERVD